MKEVLVLLVCCIALVFLVKLLMKSMVGLAMSMAGIMSVLADVLVGVMIFALVYSVSPYHPSNGLLNFGLYAIFAFVITKFLSELYLVGYSMNFVGLTIIAIFIAECTGSSSVRIGVLVVAMLMPKLFWVLARNQVGMYWVETSYSGWTNTSYGHYEDVDIDFKEKMIDINHGMMMPLQVVIAIVLYVVSNYVLLQACLNTETLLEKFSVMSCVLAIVLAVVNVIVDLVFLKKYDEAMD